MRSARTVHRLPPISGLPTAEFIAKLRDGTLIAEHGSGLMFNWRKEALPADGFAKLPRFDARTFHQARELQQRTRELLQHRAQCPAEYTDEHLKVSQLAMRFAIGPASNGLNTIIAQCFAATFLEPNGAI